jgi:hypothetical protein
VIERCLDLGQVRRELPRPPQNVTGLVPLDSARQGGREVVEQRDQPLPERVNRQPRARDVTGWCDE